jgi:MFS family permease
MLSTRRNAALFMMISAVSGFGSTSMSLVASIWIIDLTGSVSLAGLAGLCVYAPTLAAPWLGGLIDRLPRRRLVVTVDVLLAAALLTLLLVRSGEQTWLIFAVLLAYGVSHVLADAAESALLPAALPPAALGDVNGWRSSAQEGMKLVAPLAGAGLYAWGGGGTVAVLSAVMPLVAAGLYGLVRFARPVGRSAAPAPSRMRDGLAVLLGRVELRAPLLVAAVAIGMSGFTTASVYARVTDGLGLPSTFLGVLASAQGAGSIVGGLIVGRLIARRGVVAVAVTGAGMVAAASLLWCLPWWIAMVAGSFAAGVGLPWTLVAAVTAIQHRTPHRLLGRVAATATTVMFGPIALTSPLGAVAVHLGARLPLIVAVAAVVVAAIVAARSEQAGQDDGADGDEDQRDQPVTVAFDHRDDPAVCAQPGRGQAPHRHQRREHGDRDGRAGGADRAERGRVDGDVVGPVGDGHPGHGEGVPGDRWGVVAGGAAHGADQAADTEGDGDQAEQRHPPVRHQGQAERRDDRHRDEHPDAGVLPDPDLPPARTAGGVGGQEQHGQHEKVVDVRAGEDARRRPGRTQQITHGRSA